MRPLHIVELINVRVIPDDSPSENAILVEGSLSLPFTLERHWSGPSGHYVEQYVILSGDKQVFESVPRLIYVRGLQSTTTYQDPVDERIALEPGSCKIVFLIDDVPMDAVEVPVKAPAAV